MTPAALSAPFRTQFVGPPKLLVGRAEGATGGLLGLALGARGLFGESVRALGGVAVTTATAAVAILAGPGEIVEASGALIREAVEVPGRLLLETIHTFAQAFGAFMERAVEIVPELSPVAHRSVSHEGVILARRPLGRFAPGRVSARAPHIQH